MICARHTCRVFGMKASSNCLWKASIHECILLLESLGWGRATLVTGTDEIEVLVFPGKARYKNESLLQIFEGMENEACRWCTVSWLRIESVSLATKLLDV